MAGIMGLDWQQQKELLKLRGKLSFRQFMDEKSKILSAVAKILVLTPLTIGLAVATAVGYFFLPDQWPAQLLGFILIASWLVWSIAPVLSFNINEGLDPTRLLIYPISRRDFLAHMLLGTLLDYPTYFFLPFVLAIVISFGLGFALPVVLIAIFFCYLLMVLTSQTIINTVGGILRSRRFRDISVIVGALFGTSCWLISSSMQGFFESFFNSEPEVMEQFFLTFQPLDYLQWLPPGAAARAIEQAAAGAWGTSLLWLGYTALWVGLIAWLWWRVTHRIVTGQGFVLGGLPTADKAKANKAAKQAKNGRLSWSWIPTDIRAIATKELKLKWRNPQSRIGLFFMYLMPVFVVVYPLIAGPSVDIGESIPTTVSELFIIGGTLLYTIFTFWVNGQNMLAWELHGLPMLLLSPIPRQRLFFGKALAQFVLNGIPILLLSIIAIFRQPGLGSLALLPTATGLGLVSMAIVSNFSALFPYPVRVDSQSGQNPFAGGGGCLAGLANGTLMPAMLALFSLPVLIFPIGVVLLEGFEWLSLVGAVFSLAYGAVLFWFGTRLASRLLLQREPEIIAASKPMEQG